MKGDNGDESVVVMTTVKNIAMCRLLKQHDVDVNGQPAYH